ncbi:MAG: hypothetical protein IT557_00265 [Alphaproteobacteria bacterium]|nr:hypothetical protein [Alphaproteobacteria bacterium]
MRADPVIVAGLALAALAALPPVGPLLEARLPSHILGQYPLIVAGGALIGARLARDRVAAWSAAPALLAAALALSFWLLPCWIDASLADPAVRAARVASLSLLTGLPLGWGWTQAGPLLRGFFVVKATAMLAVMGWLLLAVPARLCNAHLLSDQRLLGIGMVGLAMAVIGLALLRACVGAFRATGIAGGTRHAPTSGSPSQAPMPDFR